MKGDIWWIQTSPMTILNLFPSRERVIEWIHSFGDRYAHLWGLEN